MNSSGWNGRKAATISSIMAGTNPMLPLTVGVQCVVAQYIYQASGAPAYVGSSSVVNSPGWAASQSYTGGVGGFVVQVSGRSTYSSMSPASKSTVTTVPRRR